MKLNRNEYFFQHPESVSQLLAGGDLFQGRRYTPEGAADVFHSTLSEALGISAPSPTGASLCLFHGAEDALLKILLWRGSTLGGVVLPSMSWTNYASLARGMGLAVESFPIRDDGHSFHHDFPALDALLAKSKEARIVILATPNNPTGHSIPGEILADLAARHGNHVFLVDAVYDAFPSPLASLPGRFPNVTFVGSMSKFFGLPGIRLGFAVGKFPAAFKLALGFNPYSLRVAATALAEQVHYARNWASMHEAALQLREEFTSPSLVFYPTEASFQLVRLASDLASGVDVESLAERSGALPKHFHFQGRRYLRWGLGPREVVDRIAAFHRLLEAQVRTA